MKIRIGLITMFLFCVVSLFAQPQQGNRLSAEEMAKMQTKSMVEELKLSDEQTQEVSAINLKYMKKIDEAFHSGKEDRDALRAKMDGFKTQMTAEFKAVLTADQFVQLQTMEKKIQEERRQDSPGEPKK
jgi:Spy/CpxP family protein refolding chaperone